MILRDSDANAKPKPRPLHFFHERKTHLSDVFALWQSLLMLERKNAD